MLKLFQQALRKQPEFAVQDPPFRSPIPTLQRLTKWRGRSAACPDVTTLETPGKHLFLNWEHSREAFRAFHNPALEVVALPNAKLQTTFTTLEQAGPLVPYARPYADSTYDCFYGYSVYHMGQPK